MARRLPDAELVLFPMPAMAASSNTMASSSRKPWLSSLTDVTPFHAGDRT
jgi:hypothetical protein